MKISSFILFQCFLSITFSAGVTANINTPDYSDQINRSKLSEDRIRLLLEKETGSKSGGYVSFVNLKEALQKVKTSPVSPTQALILMKNFAVSHGKENTSLIKAIEKGKDIHCFIFHDYYFFPQHTPLYKKHYSKVVGFFVDMTSGEVIYIQTSYMLDAPYDTEKSSLLFD